MRFAARTHLKRAVSVTMAVAVSVLGLTVLAGAPSALAVDPPGPAPVEQRSSGSVTADVLPTVQLDSGVVWTTVTIGNTVYAGGNFANTRPAGAAAGTNLTPRGNLLAFDITNGTLRTSFAPSLNGQVKALAASPDGSRLYVGGTFTVANGQTRYNFATYSTATGALLDYKPAVGGTYVNAIAAVDNTVYVGGLLGAGNGVARKNLMAFNATTGALLDWAPTTDLQVDAMVVTPSKNKVIIGGRFALVNGVTQRGLAALDPITGALVPWAAPATVVNGWNASPYAGKAGIFSLTSDGTNIYGTGWVYANQQVGNLEGVFAAEAESGDIRWIDDCHGDHYGVFSNGTNVYSTSHAHDCVTLGGFPDSVGGVNLRHATAVTVAAKGTLGHSPTAGATYKDWYGTAAPAMINWFPEWVTGSASGQGQAGWTMTGNTDYLVVGGEFPYVNGTLQQGLVRFARDGIAPKKNGPRWSGANWPAKAASFQRGVVRISVPENWDRDDLTLNYEFVRDDKVTTPIYKTTTTSTFWNRDTLSFTDTTQAPGTTHTYRVYAIDPNGNRVSSSVQTTTVSSTDLGAYPNAVINDGAATYWRLGESSGTTAADTLGSKDATTGAGITWGAAGAIVNDTTTAANFSGTSTGGFNQPATETGPATFSVEAWFKTTTIRGGKIIGFGSSASGTNSGNYDRHVYMTNAGRLVFGVYPGAVKTVTSTTAFNDGKWHHVVATLGTNGIRLYVDGATAGSDASVTSAQGYTGYWRVGGDNLSGWPSAPTSNYFAGSIDEVSINPTVLSAAQARAHYEAGKASAPTASFTSSVNGLTASFDASASGATAGRTVTSYSWDFGDGTPAGSGVSPTHSYAAGGTYPVKLTVTDSQNVTASVTKNVEAVAAHAAPVAVIGAPVVNGLSATFDGTGSTASDGATITGYAWDFGVAGGTSTASKPTFKYSAAGTYDVKLVVTDSEGASSVAGTRSVTVTHADPTASFTASANQKVVSVDASNSTAADGATLTYDWNWGDGTGNGSGKTATHTYAAVGDYTVTLTLTDSAGGTATTSKSVTVAAHAAPVAVIGAPVVNGLSATFDGTGSTASDGATITGYAWDFGVAGGTSTASKPSYTYPAAGTYQVKLIVTDSQGASSVAASRSVTVASAATIAQDQFGRTVASGWGTADTGGAWSASSGLSVSGGTGKMLLSAPSSTRTTSLTGVNATNVDGAVDVAFDKAATGGGYHFNLLLRKSATAEYRAKLRYASNGSVNIAIAKLVGTTETLISNKTVPGLTYTPGQVLRLRLQASGSPSSTTLNTRVWVATDQEPTAWAITVTDNQTELQGPGQVGVSSYLTGTATNAPVTATVDNFAVSAP